MTTSYLTDQNYTNYITPGGYVNLGASSVTTNVDWSSAGLQELNLDNNPTLTFSNATSGQKISLLFKQEINGQRVVTWPNEVIWNNNNQPNFQIVNGPASIDETFTGFGVGFNSDVTDILIDNLGGILMVGGFTSYIGDTYNGIIRLYDDGSPDFNFNIAYGGPTPGFDNTANSIARQSDGSLIVGGAFTSYNGVSSIGIVKLNDVGDIDGTFSTGTGFDGTVVTVACQSDDKILVGGAFTSYDGFSASRIVRLNNDGTIDGTFNNGGFNGSVGSIKIQPDGKILVGGGFSTYSGVSKNFIVRLNSNGTIDETFNADGVFPEAINSIAIQLDNKIIAGGKTGSFARINSDGSIDPTFNVGSNFDNTVSSISIQNSDGSVIVGGSFTSYNLETVNTVVKLNNNGSINTDFSTGMGTGFNDKVSKVLVINSTFKIFVGGNFTYYNGTNANKIIRLNFGDPTRYNKVDFVYNGTNYIGSY